MEVSICLRSQRECYIKIETIMIPISKFNPGSIDTILQQIGSMLLSSNKSAIIRS